MICLWEKNNLMKFDIIVVGGNLTGLHIATYLKKINPHLDILVLEKNIIPDIDNFEATTFFYFNEFS